MPYKLLYRTTFKEPGSPTFSEFVETADPGCLVDYPGLTPTEAFAQYKAEVQTRPGFISHTVTSDPQGESVIFVYETRPKFTDTTVVSPFTSLQDPLNESPIDALRYMYAVQHLSKIEVTVTEL